MKYEAARDNSLIKQVFINEEVVTNKCYFVDEEEGYADCYMRDLDGNFYIVKDKDNQEIAAHERIYGKIKVILGRR